MLRSFATLCALSLAMAQEHPCLDNLGTVADEVFKTAGVIMTSSSQCQNGTQAECLAAVRTASQQVTVLVADTTRATTACNVTSPQCGASVTRIALALNTETTYITEAISSCGKGGNFSGCVDDVLSSADQLGHVYTQVRDTIAICGGKPAPPEACIPDILDTIVVSRQAVKDVIASIKACRKHDNCGDAVKVALQSVDAVAKSAAKSAAGCGAGRIAKCITAIENTAETMSECVHRLEGAVGQCKHGIFKIACLKAVESVGSDVAHAVMDAVQATTLCKTI